MIGDPELQWSVDLKTAVPKDALLERMMIESFKGALTWPPCTFHDFLCENTCICNCRGWCASWRMSCVLGHIYSTSFQNSFDPPCYMYGGRGGGSSQQIQQWRVGMVLHTKRWCLGHINLKHTTGQWHESDSKELNSTGFECSGQAGLDCLARPNKKMDTACGKSHTPTTERLMRS